MNWTETSQKYKWQTNLSKKCSTSLSVKEVQIKTMLRFHLTPGRMTVIMNTNNNKCWWRSREKRNSDPLFVRMEIKITAMEICMEALQKNRNRTTLWFSCTASWYLSKGIKVSYFKDTCIPMFITAQFIIYKL